MKAEREWKTKLHYETVVVKANKQIIFVLDTVGHRLDKED